jgi:S1-C subfamily serine protease
MNRCLTLHFKTVALIFLGYLAVVAGPASSVRAQSFDFGRLRRSIDDYVVILKIKVEFSFGTQTNEHEEQLLGTIVTEDGLVVFDGSFLNEDNPFVPSGRFSFRSTPTRLRVTTLTGAEFSAQYVGVDRFTSFGFAQIVDAGQKFKPVRFLPAANFQVGSWLATYVLLPEFVEPRLSADIGMISSLVKAPESFPLTVGFSPVEFGGVLFDEKLRPVGLLGELSDPTQRDGTRDDMMNPYGGMGIPLFGVVTAERLEKLIADPPRRGQTARSWLGITMQALTPDIAEFLKIASPGGILVNEIIPGSPAESCGLLVGDVICTIFGERVEVDRDEELSAFQRRVSALGVGTTASLGVLRPRDDGALDTIEMSALLTAAPLAASDAAEFEYSPFEMTVRDMVFSDYIGFNIEQNSLSGVLVTKISPGGLANISGLYPGDVINRVNDQAVGSTEEFAAQMTTLETERPAEVVFFVWRFGQTMFIHVRTEWP